MINLRRPYLVVPKLIQQLTWGGDYVVKTKGLENDQKFNGFRIGQSYELFSGTKLLLGNENMGNEAEVGFAEKEATVDGIFSLKQETDYINLSELAAVNPEEVLGKKILEKYGKMPLLIKLTQAKGNSFQLHIRPGVKHERWMPKSESWYYFEKGKLTCGIKRGISMIDYKNACVEIDEYMQNLSREVINGKETVGEAREKAKIFIKKIDPWQFVQTKYAEAGEVFDMSAGGLHHSWEEDLMLPAGNILYEVQEDRMDPISTVRAFDQGKINDDGTMREINIEDYFQLLDTSLELNEGGFKAKRTNENNVFTTADYAMDVLTVKEEKDEELRGSFGHFFVKEGAVTIEAGEGRVKLSKGSSCFVPEVVGKIKIKPETEESIILKTYIPIND